MPDEVEFSRVARIPATGDNVAVATEAIAAGTIIVTGETRFSISHTILEGHRFAIEPVPERGFVSSWGLPFGVACRPIFPGDYVCNQGAIDALTSRQSVGELPAQANIANLAITSTSDTPFVVGEQVSPATDELTFMGFPRGDGRGIGTRNFIVVLGTSSRSGSVARLIAARFADAHDEHCDGVVAVAHTEGGEQTRPNNFDMLMRTLCGFFVHPNVGAVLAVELGDEAVSNEHLKQALAAGSYPYQTVPHAFLSAGSSVHAAVETAARQIEAWLPEVGDSCRQPVSAAALSIALQCGGSDAFSGISGNPLAGQIAKAVLRQGGRAVLAETDELIGAEGYILKNVRNAETAKRFLSTVDRFNEWAGWHGHSPEGNPSGGNLFRGLYNIALKSLGAAMKKAPDVRLDDVIAYGAPAQTPGFYFMDSPGNDLESIAGQVASGCNLVLFVTGNGSVTNFPFVPTLKIVTTSRRYELLEDEMDINAGAYLDGQSMGDLSAEALQLTIDVASGQYSAGERAGHSQVSVWRNWQQNKMPTQAVDAGLQAGHGSPIAVHSSAPETIKLARSSASIALLLPTSLCSGEVARLIAGKLNEERLGFESGVSRYVALPHTEGCGAASGASETLFARTILGHLLHPQVGLGFLLEHGCEKTHNDYMRQRLQQQGVDTDRFGWASIQLDGGIERVSTKVREWFLTHTGAEQAALEASPMTVGLHSMGTMTERGADGMARLLEGLLAGGCSVLVPESATMLSTPAFCSRLGIEPPSATLAFTEVPKTIGFHVCRVPSTQPAELATGLVAAGVDLLLVNHHSAALQSHPMVPLLQVCDGNGSGDHWDWQADNDHWDGGSYAAEIAELMSRTVANNYTPIMHGMGNIAFQISRGPLGISL